MSSLRDLKVLPDIPTQANWPDVKYALDNWTIASKFTYRVAKKNPNKGRYICKVDECLWVVDVSKDTDGMLEIRITHH
jgi:MuDR family transposase